MDIKIDISNLEVNEEVTRLHDEAEKAMDFVWDADPEKAAWVKEPMRRDDYGVEETIMTAIAAQDSCTLFLVICNGGIRASLKAAIDAFDEMTPTAPEIDFIGEHVSSFEYNKIIQKMRHYEVNVCVISESGMNAETIVSYQVIREAMIRRYGEEKAFKRILVMTGNEESNLHKIATKDGSGIVELKKGFSSNYFIMSSAALFVLAVAGVDIKEFRRGAELVVTDPAWDINAMNYAVARTIKARQGKVAELIQVSDPSLNAFAKWLSSMYSEAAGQIDNPMLTMPFSMARDFKDIGQAVIGRSDSFFTTEIVVEEEAIDVLLQQDLMSEEASLPTSINELNSIIASKVRPEYIEGGVEVATIVTPRMDSYHLGQIMYFFMMTATISAVMMGADPFDREAVEKIKVLTLEEVWQAGQ